MPTPALPTVSIVVPTYCESANLPFLVQRIADALRTGGFEYEILVVDDSSPDNTEETCRQLAARFPLRLIRRTRDRGLSQSVVCGLERASGTYVVVMDADLSHPPEVIPEMLERLERGESDFVVGSRYVEGGTTDSNWGVWRQWNSRVATLLARPLTQLADPMAGFFALRREDFLNARQQLNPLGYKILLELIVKLQPRRWTEIPIHFEDRVRGTSKMGCREQVRYLRHLARLYTFRYSSMSRLIRFASVGLSGATIDLSVSALLLQFAVPWSLARIIAIWSAMTWNYLGNQLITFTETRSLSWKRYMRFCASCLIGGVLNWLVSVGLLQTAWPILSLPLVAAACGILVGAGGNYHLCRSWVFRSARADSADRPAHVDHEDQRQAA